MHKFTTGAHEWRGCWTLNQRSGIQFPLYSCFHSFSHNNVCNVYRHGTIWTPQPRSPMKMCSISQQQRPESTQNVLLLSSVPGNTPKKSKRRKAWNHHQRKRPRISIISAQWMKMSSYQITWGEYGASTMCPVNMTSSNQRRWARFSCCILCDVFWVLLALVTNAVKFIFSCSSRIR